MIARRHSLFLVGIFCWALYAVAASKDRVVVPTFAVQVKLSPAARRELVRRHETIIAEAHFSGEPKPQCPFPVSDVGLALGYTSREVSRDGAAEFKNVTLPADMIRALVDTDYRVIVSVSSGRRSGPDNLLSCNVVDGKISQIKGKTHLVTCPLIAETPAVLH
jgi:hypothetical protein